MKRPAPALAALALLLAFGCAKRGAAPPPEAVAVPTPAASPSPARAPGPAVTREDLAYAAGVAAMAEKKFERALEQFTAALKEDPGHPGATQDFPEALAGLKASGDEAFRQGRLEEAGRRWSAAIRYLSHPAEKGRSVPFTKADLQANINKVSGTLMERGLVEYRKGNLEAAIAVWKSILAYDPEHAEALKSVQTATTQLENLKKITPPQK